MANDGSLAIIPNILVNNVLKFLSSITEVSEPEWDGLWQTSYPFVQHRFLKLLEDAACTTIDSGWQPYHLVYYDNHGLLAAVLLYLKHHSFGEYVFDWSWADAYARAGLNYYPKLVSAVPFTPAVGPRIALRDELNVQQRQTIVGQLLDSLYQHAAQQGVSSLHLLFPHQSNREHLLRSQLMERQACQFHWFNQNYRDFDDFLNGFSSRKRKSVRRERRKVAEEGIHLTMRTAKEVDVEQWRVFFALYHRTYLKRSGRPGYLTEGFFLKLAEVFPEQVLLCCAYKNKQMIAAALYFRDASTLYGRYWGAREEYDGLHFEACYYQGIAYAIAEGIKRFDPGAQGEHKIQRGFAPVKTCSFHHVAHQGFRRAVDAFIREEREHNEAYVADARQYLPFKEGVHAIEENCLLGEL